MMVMITRIMAMIYKKDDCDHGGNDDGEYDSMATAQVTSIERH